MKLKFNKENEEKYLGLLLLFATLIIFFSLIFCVIRYPHFGADGSFSRGLATLPVWDIIKVTAIDVHPPLYYLGLKAMIDLFAIFNFDIIYACEFFSVIPYIIILIVSYTKIKKDYGFITAGLVSLSLLAMSSFYNHYVGVRMYSWALLFVFLAFICVKGILEESSYKSWILLSICSVLCAFTHYYAAMIVFLMYVALFLHILINRTKIDVKAEFKKFAVSVVLAIILYIPWIFSLIGQISDVHESYWVSQVDMELLIDCFSNWFITTSNSTYEIIAIVVVLAFLAYMVWEYLSNRDMDDYYVLLGTLLFFGTIIFSVIISFTFKPILVLRYLTPAFALLWVAISIKIGKIKNNKILIAIIVVLLLISACNVLEQIHSQERSTDSFVKENQVYECINNNDSIILYENLPRSMRLFYRLNDTYQQYGSFVINGKNYSMEYMPDYVTNKSQFNIPDDYNKYSDKSIYVVAGPGHIFKDTGNVHFDELENNRLAPRIFKVTLLHGEANAEPAETSDGREDVTLDVTANDISAGDVLNVLVKTDSDLSRRVSIKINDDEKLSSLKGGIATAEFPDLAKGTYQVIVSYNGDEKYKPVSVTANVEVK